MYKIRFSDETEFIGGEPENSLWHEIPKDKCITSLQYSFLSTDFMLRGFEAYNHIVERAIVLLNIGGDTYPPADRISRVIVMAKWQCRVYEVVYNLKSRQVNQQIEFLSSEFKNSEGSDIGPLLRTTQAATGWLRGEFNPKVLPTIRRY